MPSCCWRHACLPLQLCKVPLANNRLTMHVPMASRSMWQAEGKHNPCNAQVSGLGGFYEEFDRAQERWRVPDEAVVLGLQARVEAAGGQILFWNGVRVMGVLAVSRAIGDHCLRPYVIAQPEVCACP